MFTVNNRSYRPPEKPVVVNLLSNRIVCAKRERSRETD